MENLDKATQNQHTPPATQVAERRAYVAPEVDTAGSELMRALLGSGTNCTTPDPSYPINCDGTV